MKVDQLMTKDVLTCSPSDSLEQAARLMWEHDCGTLPVVDDTGRTVGMITDRDISMCAYMQGRRLAEIPVALAASTSLFPVHVGDSLHAAEDMMRRGQVHRVPVVDGGGRPVGLLSLGDIARHMSGHDGLSARTIAQTLAAITAPHDPALAGPVYRVRTVGAGGWEVFDRAGRRVSERMETQSDAVVHAKELAHRDGSAQIIVHAKDGTIASEFFYQKEERASLESDDMTRSMAATRPARARKPGARSAHGKGAHHR